jgi:hypothetical protein
MSGIRHQEFLNEQKDTTYPFTPSSSLTNGLVTLSPTVFTDCALYPALATTTLYLTKVSVSYTSLEFYLGTEEIPEMLTGTVALPVSVAAVTLFDQYERVGGLLTFEQAQLGIIAAWGEGDHLFTRAQTEFCVSCHQLQPGKGLAGFRLPDGTVVTGEVWFVGGDGVVLRRDGSDIRVDVVGDPLFLQKTCNDLELYQPVHPIRKIRVINGDFTFECTPSTAGNFSISMNNALVENAALRVHTTELGVMFELLGSSL